MKEASSSETFRERIVVCYCRDCGARRGKVWVKKKASSPFLSLSTPGSISSDISWTWTSLLSRRCFARSASGGEEKEVLQYVWMMAPLCRWALGETEASVFVEEGRGEPEETETRPKVTLLFLLLIELSSLPVRLVRRCRLNSLQRTPLRHITSWLVNPPFKFRKERR